MRAIFPIRNLSARSISTIATSATIAASMFIAVPALVNASTSAPNEKHDLADTQDCQTQNWPYYARACLRDESKNAGGRAVKARLITTDQIERAKTRGPDIEATIASNEKTADASSPEAPADWMLSDRDVRTYVSAGDFIRRTVR